MRASPSLLLAALALPAVLPSVARAQIHLAWNNCITEADAAQNLDYACNGSRNGVPFRLVCSFVSPANLGAFVGVQMTILVETYGPPYANLPDYWRLGVDDCRDGNISFPASLVGVGTGLTGACRNPWAGANLGGGFEYESGFPAAHQARLRMAFARDSETSVVAGQQYVGGIVSIDSDGDVPQPGVATCDGCCVPVELVLTVVELYQTVGSPPQDVIVLTGPGQQQVTWQQSGCPAPAPGRTWGAVKSTYR